jgi:MoaA/NifB/PqqE/SkfB family radical SAM enzyme
MTKPLLQMKKDTIESFLRFSEGKEIPKWPLEIFLEISNICDLKCAMCINFSALNPFRHDIIRGSKRGLMSIEEGTEPLESLLQHALQVHAFGYGEPTIHPNFKEFLQYLTQFQVLIDFFTNGMHLTEDLCNFLVEKQIFKLSISFSGASKEDYENVYIGGDFERVLSGIKRLSTAKKAINSSFPIIEVNSIAFQHHVNTFPEFVQLMGEHGVNVIHLKPLSTYDLVKEMHGHISIPRTEVEIPLLEEAKEIAKQFGITIASKPYERMTVSSNEEYEKSFNQKHRGEEQLSEQFIPIHELKQVAANVKRQGKLPAIEKSSGGIFLADNYERVKDNGTPCLEPFKTFYAAYNGDVYPCCFWKAHKAIGSLKNSTGEDIWRNSIFSTIRDEIIAKKEYPKALCESCLKAKQYPQTHSILQKFNSYTRWAKESFDMDFAGDLKQKVKNMPDNDAIFNAFNAHTSNTPPSAINRFLWEAVFAVRTNFIVDKLLQIIPIKTGLLAKEFKKRNPTK